MSPMVRWCVCETRPNSACRGKEDREAARRLLLTRLSVGLGRAKTMVLLYCRVIECVEVIVKDSRGGRMDKRPLTVASPIRQDGLVECYKPAKSGQKSLSRGAPAQHSFPARP